MSFIRPEVSAALWRWRDVAAGGGLIAVGALVATGRVGFLGVLGWAMIAVGITLVYAGIARGRFRNAGGGRGVVEVDERAIRYLGPDIGGAVALGSVVRLAVVAPHAWEVTDVEGQRLTIPVNAENAEALFDAFVSLPGLSAGQLAEAAGEAPTQRTVIWERAHGRIS